MSFMDAREHGAKMGTGYVSEQQANQDRRERLRKLALETIDLAKDPYFFRNHVGQYECRLCLTVHTTEGSYLAHTQGRRHQQNLAKRAALQARDAPAAPAPARRPAAGPARRAVRIGRPGYQVTKQFDPETRQRSLLFEIDYREIEEGRKPRHRFMSAYEQRKEDKDHRFQYLLFAAEPYEVIAFKVSSSEIDKREGRFFTHWDPDGRRFSLRITFKQPKPLAGLGRPVPLPPPPPHADAVPPWAGGASHRPPPPPTIASIPPPPSVPPPRGA